MHNIPIITVSLLLLLLFPIFDVWWHGAITGLSLLGSGVVALVAARLLITRRGRQWRSLRRELERSNVHFYL